MKGSLVPLAFLSIVVLIFIALNIREYQEWQDSSRWEAVQSSYFILSRGQVYYEYEVNGQTYDNDRVRFLSALFNPRLGLIPNGRTKIVKKQWLPFTTTPTILPVLCWCVT